MAEGTPPEEGQEPMAFDTAALPQISEDTDGVLHYAETGLVAAVEVPEEGKEKGDSQDASLTTDETQASPQAQEATEVEPRQAPAVLIVEDTTELAEIIQVTLERMDMITAHETHGNKAIAKLKEMNPDVVLLDISLPDMTGWKIMDAIKEHQAETKRMPRIIVITAYDDPANRLVGKLQGVHGYLIKPFTADEIERAVTQAIGGGAAS